MSTAWKRFLFLQFPIAMVTLALVGQALGWALANVPMRRDRTDELALAVSQDPTNYRVLVLADSITRNATSRYVLGGPGEVGNLATHAHFGITGELLLLERYLRVHEAPQYVVLDFSPSMYGWVTDIRLVRYNLWQTFRQPSERAFLKTYFPDIDRRDWLPAIADLQERLVEPFYSFLKQKYLAHRKRDVATIAVREIGAKPRRAGGRVCPC